MTIKIFITPVYPYGNDHYYHEMIALAEGFKELGHKIIGNCNYWWQPEEQQFLINEDIDGDYDIAIYCWRYVLSFEHLLFRPGYPNINFNKINILNDRNDFISPIWLNPHYSIFDLILAGSMVEGLKVPSNVRPWAIGLTKRIVNSIDQFYNENEKIEPIMGCNFTTEHNLRKFVNENISKLATKFPYKAKFTSAPDNSNSIDSHYYKTTTRRHVPEYFKSLNECLMFSAFCGYMEYLPKLYQPYNVLDKIWRKPHALLNDISSDKSKHQFVFQYDSFRTWETFYARTCPLNLDFETWGFILPEMPKNGIHYLGMNRFDFKNFVDRIEAMKTEEILSIGIAGRKWVAEHYSPKAQALRLLNYLKDSKKM